MTVILWIFCFLACNLWGVFIGAKFGNKNVYGKVFIPQGNFLIGAVLFTGVALSLFFTTPVSDFGAIGTLVASIAGFIIGIFVGRNIYDIY